MENNRKKTIIAQALISVVVFVNLQSAIAFLLYPDTYSPGFELQGIPGRVAILGIAILFIMWNVPYLFALWKPAQNRTSLYESNLMQLIGLIGETWILLQIPEGFSTLSGSIFRFITFDFLGLILLILAAWITNHKRLEKH